MFELFPSLDIIVLSHNNLSGLLPLSLGNSKVMCLRLNDQGEGAGFTGSITIIASMISLCIVVFTNVWKQIIQTSLYSSFHFSREWRNRTNEPSFILRCIKVIDS